MTGPPTGGKPRNTRILGHFGLGRQSEQSQARAKNGKLQFLGAEGAGMKKNVTTLSGIVRTFWPTGPPGAGSREIRGFQAILAHDGLLHLEESWARAENTISRR